jgi:hypothetical protein
MFDLEGWMNDAGLFTASGIMLFSIERGTNRLTRFKTVTRGDI